MVTVLSPAGSTVISHLLLGVSALRVDASYGFVTSPFVRVRTLSLTFTKPSSGFYAEVEFEREGGVEARFVVGRHRVLVEEPFERYDWDVESIARHALVEIVVVGEGYSYFD